MSGVMSIAIGLFARSLIKSGGDVLLGASQSLVDLFKKELVVGVAAEAPATIKGVIERLNLKKTSRDKLLNSGSIIDLAGLAWAEILTEQSDEDVSRFTSESNAQSLARRLDPHWFVNAVTSPRADEVAFAIGSKAPSDQIEASVLDKTVAVVGAEIRDELQLADDIDPRPLVEKVVARMPERIYELWLTVPGIEARVTRLNTEAILKHVSGSADRDDIQRALHVLAQQLIDVLNEDVFGRQVAQPNEPPILRHGSTYVEPEATLGRARAKGPVVSERGPVKGVIRKVWSSEPKTQLVMIHAPFGYGKSLTIKSLAAELAVEWKKNPGGAPFPVLLRCPEVLSGHVSTLKAAVQNSIEKQTGLATSAVERIWNTHKLVLLLDSFDEVHMGEKEAQGWIGEMQRISNGDRVRVVVASRPHAFRDKWLGPNDWEVALQPFDESRGQQWLDAVAGLFGPKNLTFKEVSSTLDAALAGTPILLVMAAYGWNENAASVPNSKASIYRRFIEKISTGKWSDIQEAHQVVLRGVDVLTTVAGPHAFRKALRLLAWEYLRAEQRLPNERDHLGLSRRHVGDTLQANFKSVGEEQINEITHSLCLSLFLHKAAGAESVVFTHRSFREYLCAEHVVDTLRSRRVGTHYLSPAWQLMAEAELGEADLAFAGELLQEVDADERAHIVRQFDEWCTENRAIFFKTKDGLQIEKTGQDVEIGLAPQEANRSRVFHVNVERLSIVGRSISLTAMAAGLHVPVAMIGARELPPLPDGMYRVVNTIMHRAGGVDGWSFGYHVGTGNGALICPIGDVDLYRENLRKAPDVMVPIAHVAKTYFACSAPGLHVIHFWHGIRTAELLLFSEFGRLLRRAEAAGLRISLAGLNRPGRTPDGFLLWMSSGDDVNLKQWWSHKATFMLTNFMFERPHHFGLHLSSQQVRSVHVKMGIVMLWDENDWDELFKAYDDAVGILEDSMRRTTPAEEDE